LEGTAVPQRTDVRHVLKVLKRPPSGLRRRKNKKGSDGGGGGGQNCGPELPAYGERGDQISGEGKRVTERPYR